MTFNPSPMPFPVFRPLRDATAPSHPLDLNALHATLEPLLAPASSWPAAMLRMKQMQEAKDAIFVHAPEILRLATIGQMVERAGLAEELTTTAAEQEDARPGSPSRAQAR